MVKQTRENASENDCLHSKTWQLVVLVFSAIGNHGLSTFFHHYMFAALNNGAGLYPNTINIYLDDVPFLTIAVTIL